MDEQYSRLNEFSTDCLIGELLINQLMYANDLAILYPYDQLVRNGKKKKNYINIEVKMLRTFLALHTIFIKLSLLFLFPQ